MRHAVAGWGSASGRDHETPLLQQGIEDSRGVGRFLADVRTIPDLVLSSTALRALTTVKLAAEAGGWGCEIVTSADLYGSAPERILEMIGEIESGVDRLLISGHEPTWSTLVGWLIGGGRVRMPPAAVACLDLPHGDWNDLAPASCVLRWLVTPEIFDEK